MTGIRKHLTYSNVMVTLLAFVVLGGTAWALAKNSVGTKQLKANAVHTKDIDDGAVTAEKIAQGVLDTTVRPTSQTIPLNCTETSFAPGSYFVTCSGQATITAPCNAGERLISGGYQTPPPGTGGPTAGATVLDSRPDPTSGTPNAWVVRASAFGTNSGTSPGVPRPADPQVSVYAICSA
jgi:hypothetical protein